MLLTLSANCLRSRLTMRKGRTSPADALALTDLPRFARNELGLHGLNLSTSLLAGADMSKIDAIRDAADKAPCPCLVLVESDPLVLTSGDSEGDVAGERLVRVIKAANRLGCNSVALSISGGHDEESQDFAVERLRRVMNTADRMEVNLLVMPVKGLTEDPDRLTDMIKKVGGFRVGTMPDFEVASKSTDAISYLRRLVPYAAGITASSIAFKPGKKGGVPAHDPYDLVDYCRIVQAVGYTGTLAIDYRGKGDLVDGILNTKAILESCLELDTEEPALAGPMEDGEEIELPDEEDEK